MNIRHSIRGDLLQAFRHWYVTIAKKKTLILFLVLLAAGGARLCAFVYEDVEGKYLHKAKDLEIITAADYFAERNYRTSRAHYRKALELALCSGTPPSEEPVCLIRYGIALTYFYESDYANAYRAVLDIQRLNPGYEPDRILWMLTELETRLP